MALAANGLPSPSTAWKEMPLAGEPALFEDFAGDIVAYQKKDADKNGPLRGFHAKIHAGFIAEFQVLADLPEHARHGVFAEPRTFPAVVRFSNGESRIYADTNHEPRGIAIKLIGALRAQIAAGAGRRRDPGLPGHQPFGHLDGSRRQAVHSFRQGKASAQAANACKDDFHAGSRGDPAHWRSPLPYGPSQRCAKHGHRGVLRHGAD